MLKKSKNYQKKKEKKQHKICKNRSQLNKVGFNTK